VQFGPAFTFPDARRLAPYLRRLGVGDVYASPLLAARAGSEHGYDVVDPARLSDDLGGAAGFDAMSEELARRDLGLLLDVVPNHMAASDQNPWWWDVLRHGRQSAFASFFDIDWAAGGGQVLLPVLGGPFGEVLEAGEIALAVESGEPVVRYHEHRFPVDPRSYEGRPGDLPALNGTSGEPRTFDVLEALLDRQHYRLADWRIAAREIDYRRFFDISDLVSLRMEDPAVFDATHALVLELARQGRVTGLRVDHVDGLLDPAGYLTRLQGRLGDGYVVVEKILGRDEALAEDWAVAGTTGYEFADLIDGLLVDPAGEERLLRAHAAFVAPAGRRRAIPDLDFDELAARCKREVLDLLFAGEGRTLAAQLHSIAALDRHGRDLTEDELRAALVEVMAWLPVYRTYTTGPPAADVDRRVVDQAVRAAAAAADDDLRRAVEFVGRVLRVDTGPGWDPSEVRDWVRFVMRWQKLTGPVTAKGVEDTALYRWDGLVSRSDVGADPSRPAVAPAEFHRRMRERRRRWPGSLNAGSTHDSKRSEDVRARLDVLSELPEEWAARLARWRRMNVRHARRPRSGGVVPDPSFELHLYQSMVGVWPLDPGEPEVRRIQDYAVKAAREAKVHTSWLAPSRSYERAVRGWVRAVLGTARFRSDLDAFVDRIGAAGATNSLGGLVLRATAPGVPDVYQGTELWSFALVDPDNRRPVDFERRASLLDGLDALEPGPRAVRALAASWRDGRIKLHVLRSLLEHRRYHPDLFADGAYLPLEVTGRRRANVVAFARRLGRSWTVALVPRLTDALAAPGRLPTGSRAWPATVVHLPRRAPATWTNLLTGEPVAADEGVIRVRSAFATLPVAVLIPRPRRR
jgi:(1->4)-alpha-D-glucan 1-alpha-D-glucosylmutase